MKKIFLSLLLAASLALGQNMQATGGTITYSGGKTIHSFTASGTFTVISGVGTVNYLIVGGHGQQRYGPAYGASEGGCAGGVRGEVPPEMARLACRFTQANGG